MSNAAAVPLALAPEPQAGLPSASAGLRYGALGLPLAFVALPLYMLLPAHYADRYGLPLAALGAVLLGARLLDALADPLIGRWIDRLFARGAHRAWCAAVASALLLTVGFQALFFPLVQGQQALLWRCCGGARSA